MSLPYLQVGQELVEHIANDASILLDCSEAEAGWMILKMWGYGLSRCHRDEAFDGAINLGSKSGSMLEARVGWRGEQGAFIRAAETLELLEVTDVGLRIKGMERYRRALLKRKRPGPSKRAASGESPAEVRRQSAGQTPDETYKNAGPIVSTSLSTSPKEKGVQGEEDFELAAVMEGARQRACPQAQRSPPSAYMFAAWRKQAADFSGPVLLAAYECFLANPWARSLEPAPCPWGAWQKKWREFIPGQGSESERKADVRKAPIRAEEMRHGPVGEVML